jgi:hypothetical protein
MAEGDVVGSAPDLVDDPVGEADGVEVVHDQHGVGQCRPESVGVTAEGVDRGRW